MGSISSALYNRKVANRVYQGIGKTSLIKSIVQVCEDIVHVDPISTNSSQKGVRAGPSYYAINSRSNGDSTKDITEVYASTRPYPHWWTELDDSRLLRKRRSKSGIDDQVIERNLCFVDTPGYGVGTSVRGFFITHPPCPISCVYELIWLFIVS